MSTFWVVSSIPRCENVPDEPVGIDPTPSRPEPPSTLDKLGKCALEQVGLGEAGSLAAGVSGANVLPTRAKPAGSTPGTSVASRASRAVFGNAHLPFQVPTAVGIPGLGNGMSIKSVSRIATVVGRSIPVVGWVLVAADIAMIGYCTFSDE